MNTSILQKCLSELTKESPDLSYIRGMLETLVEIQGVGQRSVPDATFSYKVSVPTSDPVYSDTPEGMAVDAALASLTAMPQPKKTGVIETNITL